MKHKCHCGLEAHRQCFLAKKFGLFGAVLMGLHILFHVLECLLLPGILVAFGGHAVEENATAISDAASSENRVLEDQPAFCRLELPLDVISKATASKPLGSLCPPR